MEIGVDSGRIGNAGGMAAEIGQDLRVWVEAEVRGRDESEVVCNVGSAAAEIGICRRRWRGR